MNPIIFLWATPHLRQSENFQNIFLLPQTNCMCLYFINTEVLTVEIFFSCYLRCFPGISYSILVMPMFRGSQMRPENESVCSWCCSAFPVLTSQFTYFSLMLSSKSSDGSTETELPCFRWTSLWVWRHSRAEVREGRWNTDSLTSDSTCLGCHSQPR